MFHILVVEDSDEYRKIITRTLSDHRLTCASSAEEASSLIRSTKFDLFVVDINLPKRDGFSLLTEFQGEIETKNTPVLCLTARKEITDKVTAFSLGADDYITKPFDPIELKARVDTKLKKNSRRTNEDEITTIGDIEIDHSRHRVMIGEGPGRLEVPVTQTEFKLLCCFARRPQQVFSRDQLLVAAWGEDAKVLDRVVDAHVCLLRKKLKSNFYQIKAVTFIGYNLVPLTSKKRA